MIGEIGGRRKRRPAEWIQRIAKKPVAGLSGEQRARPGRRNGTGGGGNRSSGGQKGHGGGEKSRLSARRGSVSRRHRREMADYIVEADVKEVMGVI